MALNLGTMLTGMWVGTPPEMQTTQAAAGKAKVGWGVSEWRGMGSSQSGSNGITAQWPTGLSLPGEGFLLPLEGTPVPPHCCALSLLDPHLPGKRAQSLFCRPAAHRTPTRKPPGGWGPPISTPLQPLTFSSDPPDVLRWARPPLPGCCPMVSRLLEGGSRPQTFKRHCLRRYCRTRFCMPCKKELRERGR